MVSSTLSPSLATRGILPILFIYSGYAVLLGQMRYSSKEDHDVCVREKQMR